MKVNDKNGDLEMSFEEYLQNRHTIQPKTRQLSEVSVEQYVNRLHNLKRLGIYREEKELTEEMLERIEKQYTNGLKHYPRTITYYIEFLNYRERA